MQQAYAGDMTLPAGSLPLDSIDLEHPNVPHQIGEAGQTQRLPRHKDHTQASEISTYRNLIITIHGYPDFCVPNSREEPVKIDISFEAMPRDPKARRGRGRGSAGSEGGALQGSGAGTKTTTQAGSV